MKGGTDRPRQILPLRNIGKSIQQRRRELATDTRTCPFFCAVKRHARACSGTQVRLASLETEQHDIVRLL